MIDTEDIRRMQDAWTVRWHEVEDAGTVAEGAAELMAKNHRANFDLWHEEDKARDPRASNMEIARVKRAIDGLNQRRNDLVEEMDEQLLRGLPTQGADAPLHSETPGMMIDRMSILALKIYHTREQAEREDATVAHRLKSADRLRVLEEQRGDLARCLDSLWKEVLRGGRRFKVYRQMKMYNDPEMNPAIYEGKREEAREKVRKLREATRNRRGEEGDEGGRDGRHD